MEAPKVEPTQDDLIEEEMERREQDIFENPLGKYEGKSLDQLKELEDEIDEDDMAVLRRKRLQMLKEQAARNKYGTVINISEPEWKTEVTDAGDVWVVVNLWAHGRQECSLIDGLMRTLAGKFRDVKFVRIEGRQAIKNFPDTKCPTMLVYHKSDVKLQLIGLPELGGPKASANSLEWVLAQLGAVKTELTEDPSIEEQRMRINRLEKARAKFEDDGDDWLNE
jgi:hypothetical protein